MVASDYIVESNVAVRGEWREGPVGRLPFRTARSALRNGAA